MARLPTFRGAFKARRCLVPAEAFYEWKRDGTLKQPFAIARSDGAPLAFGGIWESWTDPASGHVTRTFAIITTDANATMAAIHNRMPVVLEPADWPVWLGEAEGEGWRRSSCRKLSGELRVVEPERRIRVLGPV